MNQLQTKPDQINAISAMDAMMNNEVMNQVHALANVMSTSKVTVPKHLQGSLGDCFAVVLQSMQWGMNPFAVAQKTHLVNGTLGYEAQLVNAVITTRAPTQERLKFEWFGDWSKINGKEDKSNDKGVKVWATLKGETEPRTLEVSMAQVGSVRNSPLWVSDPRQQLAYLAIKRWARLYCPDVILGVYTPDEFDEPVEKDVTPASKPKANSGASALKERLKKNNDTAPTLLEIQQAQTLEQLEEIGGRIRDMNFDTESLKIVRAEYKAKRENLTAVEVVVPTPFAIDDLLNDLENANELEQLQHILSEKFEPFTSQMNAEQIEQVTNTYERKIAELSE